MASSQCSEGTLQGSPPKEPHTSLDLASLPPIFLSNTHLDTDELHELEDNIVEAGGHLTYDLNEAGIVLTKAERKRRIQLDLRTKGCYTDEVVLLKETTPPPHIAEPAAKRPRLSCVEDLGKDDEKAVVIDDSETESESDEVARARPEPVKRKREPSPVDKDPNQAYFSNSLINVLSLEWFEKSLKHGTVLLVEPYLRYQGRRVNKPDNGSASFTVPKTPAKDLQTSPQSILERARADAAANTSSPSAHTPGQRRLGQIGGGRLGASAHTPHSRSRAHLLHQTTSEHDLGVSSDLPEMPDWVKQDFKYACQRSTPPNPPNADFINQLKKIKLARLLTNDEIGVRAYSTSIASLAAYPYRLSSPREILALPGCDAKIANLYVEYANHGRVPEADDTENNEELKVLKVFYDIWGVGATTAREFYYEHGWRNLDDIVENGWATLSRVQQIGVKYYNEFLSLIPRSEVEEIAAEIQRHAVKVRDDQIQSLVVGGYRRGKEECGDVDVIVSHPDESKTLNIVNDIVASLEEEGWITHTLLVSTTSSNREQQTLPLKFIDSHGSGFDTLDKALVVWQDPHWRHKTADLAVNPKAKNPNIHRRVDIIISPWKTVGCAVMGWSGGTTFQRDLRRYVRQAKGWKFDSSGVRDRSTGQTVDVDGYFDKKTRAKDMVEAEKRVFENLGLVWREPVERCTG